MKGKRVIKIVVIVIGALFLSMSVYAARSALLKNRAIDNASIAEAEGIIEQTLDRQSDKDNEPLMDIPIYTEFDLLYEFGLIGKDTSPYSFTGSMPNSVEYILTCYPGASIRKMDDGKAYLVYDTDTGYRLFLLMDKNLNYMATIGYPIVIKEQLSIKDFAGVKVGDSIDEVCAIDSCGEVYKTLIGIYGYNKQVSDYLAEKGKPISSIHYLSNGLLKIEYSIDENDNIIITNILFDEDYVLENTLGNPVDYRICDIDLP